MKALLVENNWSTAWEKVSSLPASRLRLIIVGASLLACLSVPMLSKGPYADLGGYSDHLRNTALSWIAFHRGFEVYQKPYGKLIDEVPFRHAVQEWRDVPYINAPGALLLFAPMAAIGQWVPLSDAAFGRLCLSFVVILAHWALWAVLKSLQSGALGVRILVSLFSWTVLIRAGLNGQYDPVWVGCGALMLAALSKGQWRRALLLFSLAGFVHYRAVVLTPFAWPAIAQLFTSRNRRDKAVLLLLGAAAAVVISCFAVAIGSGDLFRDTPALIHRPGDPLLLLAVGAAFIGAAIAVHLRDWMLVASVALVSLIALYDTQHWWHALIVLAPLLRVAVQPLRTPQLAQLSMLAWAIAMQNVWLARPLALFKSLWRFASGI